MVVNEVKEKFATIISTITSPKKSPDSKQVSRKRKLVGSDENVDDSSSPSSDKMNSRSLEDFYKRLKTFTASEWFGKPLCLSPFVMASYGWYLLKEDVVMCASCNKMFVVDLPWSGSENYASEVLKCVENIRGKKSKMCAWVNSHVAPSNVQDGDQFQSRVNSLVQLGDKLPHISDEVLEQIGVSRDDVRQIHSTVKTDDVNSDDVIVSAVVLAMCGWEKSENELVEMLTCKLTMQNIGLWGITSIESKSVGKSPKPRRGKRRSGGGKESDDKKQEETRLFHPLDEHYIWSPWICNMNINNLFENPLQFGIDDATSTCGWKSLKRALMTSHNKTTNQKLDSQKAFERADKLLSSWDSPNLKKNKYLKIS